MKIFKAPNRNTEADKPVKIFLAGSIEMGVAENWQDRVTKELSKYNIEIYNPRRDDWDSSWVQDPTEGTQFHEQVSWELEHMDEADIILFYFDANTKSPITLMELGIALASDKEVFVFCPQEFFRYGNVVVTANYYDEKVYINEDNWFTDIKLELESISYTEEMKEEVEEVPVIDIEEGTEVIESNVVLNEMYKYYDILNKTKNEKVENYIREKYDGKK